MNEWIQQCQNKNNTTMTFFSVHDWFDFFFHYYYFFRPNTNSNINMRDRLMINIDISSFFSLLFWFIFRWIQMIFFCFLFIVFLSFTCIRFWMIFEWMNELGIRYEYWTNEKKFCRIFHILCTDHVWESFVFCFVFFLLIIEMWQKWNVYEWYDLLAFFFW